MLVWSLSKAISFLVTKALGSRLFQRDLLGELRTGRKAGTVLHLVIQTIVRLALYGGRHLGCG
jgi:hypothetical protein